MKIAFLVHEFPRASQPFILNQVTGLSARGHDVTVYARAKPDIEDLPASTDCNLGARNIYTPIPKNKFKRILWGIPTLAKGLSRAPIKTMRVINPRQFGQDAISLRPLYRIIPLLKESFDIVHCHFAPNGQVGSILKKAGIEGQLLTTFHGYGVRQAKRHPERYDLLFEICDCFLANSKYIYGLLAEIGVDKERLFLHPNGIALNEIPFRWGKNSSPSPDCIELVTVARLAEEKGIKYAIRAIAELETAVDKELKYHLIGDGERRKPLEALTEQLGLTDVIVFHGYKNRQVVFQHLARSHLFVLPSVEEAFGMALLEAQAVGLPVVATNVGGIPEAVNRGNSGVLVDARNPTALAKALENLIETPEKWPWLGRNGRDYVKRNFDIEVLNDQLVKIYRSFT